MNAEGSVRCADPVQSQLPAVIPSTVRRWVGRWLWRPGTPDLLLKPKGVTEGLLVIEGGGNVDVQHPLTFLSPLPWFCVPLAVSPIRV